MGCFDRAEVCELVGTHILTQLDTVFKNENVGLYRDDGLGIFRNLSGPAIERKRKAIVCVFKKCGLSITTKANLKALNFLDIQLDLINSSYRPYRTPNDNPMYIDINPNRPPNIKKQIPKSISKRICELSSKEEIFNNNIRTYNDALKRCEFQEKLVFVPEVPSDPPVNQRRKRKHKIIWFNPPYSKNVRTNIAKVFSNLLHKNFPSIHLFQKFLTINYFNYKL